jgi:hypothetical protein
MTGARDALQITSRPSTLWSKHLQQTDASHAPLSPHHPPHLVRHGSIAVVSRLHRPRPSLNRRMRRLPRGHRAVTDVRFSLPGLRVFPHLNMVRPIGRPRPSPSCSSSSPYPSHHHLPISWSPYPRVMLATAFRSLRTVAVRQQPAVAARAFSVSAMRSAGLGPPTLLGEVRFVDSARKDWRCACWRGNRGKCSGGKSLDGVAGRVEGKP